MLRKYVIHEEEGQLSLTFTPYGLALPLNKLLLLVVAAVFVTLSVSVNHMIGLLGMILMLIIAVISGTPGLQQTIAHWRNGKSFHFDKSKNEFLIDGKLKGGLSDISVVEINHERSHDSNMIYLDLWLSSGLRIRLLESNSYKEYTAVGRQIARFCKVEFWNNSPHEKELLWGTTQASDKDIAALNSRHSKYG